MGWLLGSGCAAEAHDLCHRACAADLENPCLWRLLGEVEGRCGRYREAEEDLERALTIAPSDPESWYLLGGVFQMQGRFPPATEAFRRTLQLRPDHAGAREAIGYVLQVVGDLDGAESAYEILLRSNPDHGSARYNLGLVYEELVRLPGGFLCYSPDHRCPAVSDSPSLSCGHIVFGSFNNVAKLSPELLETWAAILKAVPDSRLLLKRKAFTEEPVRERYIEAFAGFEVDHSRVHLIPWSLTPRRHMMQYARVDIALDTFPYAGTTTSCEALWMGVPVITLRGSRHAGRVGASILESLGCRDSSPAAARSTWRWRSTWPAIPGVRRSLRPRMASSALCDAGRLCREVEASYRAMWRTWCESGWRRGGEGLGGRNPA